MADRTLDHLFNHIFLPTRVPQADDYKDGAGDRALMDHLTKWALLFRDRLDSELYPEWSRLCWTLRTFTALHHYNNSFAKDALRNAFSSIKDGDIIFLHIALQNSGLIMRKVASEYIIESFEASAPAAKVLSAQNALQWDFPSRAVAVPASTFEDISFQASLAEFLEKASVEPVKQFAATTLKAGYHVYESRDTTDPAIVGQLLMALLEANGRKKQPILTRKRIRDEVCWSDGSENPWRRSATWLVLRVGLQRSLCFLLGASLGTLHYKLFMCFLVSSVCEQLCAEDAYPSDRLGFARTKLARRIAKLQHRKDLATPAVANTITCLLPRFDKEFRSTMYTVNDKLMDRWSLIRRRTTKRVLLLPRRADPESTTLSLLHSRPILQRILDEDLYGRPPVQLHLQPRHRDVTHHSAWINIELQDSRTFLDYLKIADFEVNLLAFADRAENEPEDSQQICKNLAHNMQQYQDVAFSAYKSDPEQMSLMLLVIMELWQALDSIALKRYPTLAQYDPGFPHDLLYPLQILQLDDMRRLQRIENYIAHRRRATDPSLPSIFGDIKRNSFGVKYYDQCRAMQMLSQTITAADDLSKAQKGEELDHESRKYEDMVKEMTETACLFIDDQVNPLKRQHDDRRCRKHYLERRTRRMRIQIHEGMLPADANMAKAIVFELLLPQDFGAWRDGTWQILTLAQGLTPHGYTPEVLIQEYSGLRSYSKSTETAITLASGKKSFLNTHYLKVPFPTSLDRVCLPHAPKYGFYDHRTKLWTSKCLNTPSFADLCAHSLPLNSIYSPLSKFLHPNFRNSAISANDAVASQTCCPSSLTIPEYTIFQDLRLGRGLQWIRLLRELASPNLNFGTVEVGALVSELALMAGPSEGHEPLRANHWVFRDPGFCTALGAEIKRRLDNIAANWREGQTAGCLIVLLERLWSLATSVDSVKEAKILLLYARKMAHEWTRLLRVEVYNALDVETAQKRSKDALTAALLSRKTFMIEAANPKDMLQPEGLACFLECSFTVKDYLPKNEPAYIAKMPASLRGLYLGDIRLVQNLESQIKLSIQTFPEAVNQAVNSVWADAKGNVSRAFTRWTLLPAPHSGWITAKSISADGLLGQNVHVDIFEGTLLIDHQLLGQLPDEYTKQELFQQLFGSHVFLTYPSAAPGMSYMLASLFQGHEIHFGFRDGNCFIRARSRGRMMELIPRTAFSSTVGGDVPDLPLPLIYDHVHWLDLGSHTLEIRPCETMWRTEIGNWKINLRTSGARRRACLLVDPRSLIFGRVATIIEPFEQRNKMTIYQPEGGSLSLHLPRLELSFHINNEGLLESRQLRAMVDIDQDAGTLYGLSSSLVLRDCIVPEDRSVVVAMGPAELVSDPTGHVKIHIKHTGYYARFFINKELGRLECAAEPRLIYFKAFCHAATSYVLHDPLTGRTGTDEAIHGLEAGNAQPWAPAESESYRILLSIAGLTPQRFYYPEKLKVLQKVVWGQVLMPSVQHDAFRPVVEDILHQCRLLRTFNSGGDEPPGADRVSDDHLLVRATTRNQTYRANQHKVTTSSVVDLPYVGRDSANNTSSENAHEAAILLKNWSSCIDMSHGLAGILQQWPVIQGFDHDFDLYLFADLIAIDLASNWGSLFRFCQGSSKDLDRYKLMFLFATMSFDENMDMTVMRSLIGVAILGELKMLPLPGGSSFIQFRGAQIPTIDFLLRVLSPHQIPYPEDDRTLLPATMHSKQRRKLETAQRRHEEQSENSCKAFARHLLPQWPCREPSVGELEDLPFFDSESAFLAIKPEWERLLDNYHLSKHLEQVQKVLDMCKADDASTMLSRDECEQEFFPTPKAFAVRPTLWDLMRELSGNASIADNGPCRDPSNTAPRFLDEVTTKGALSALDPPVYSQVRPPSILEPSHDPVKTQNKTFTLVSELENIVFQFSSSEDAIRRTYGRNLQSSIAALKLTQAETLAQALNTNKQDPVNLDAMVSSSRSAVHDQFNCLRKALIQGNQWLDFGGLLPDISPVTVLETLPKLAETKDLGLALGAVLSYAQLVVKMQHRIRVYSAHQRGDDIQIKNESQRGGHTKWQAREHIDWLLLQIDLNLLIRQDQYEVAQAMTAPKSKSNFVLQMNMGQGKSSVIIPMIVAQMANGKNLVRVVVPRPLLLQMAQLLQSRLGGLMGRVIKHIPFFRKSSTEISNLKAYHTLHLDILRTGGVILALPEHMLSFQLSGLQELSNGNVQQATAMMKIQDWFARKCRDILDECDHMLAVKTQLIYPSGSQSMVDAHPTRWRLVQDLLKLIQGHLKQLRKTFPRSIEVVDRSSGTFPTIYLLNEDVKEALAHSLIESILRGEGGILPIEGFSHEEVDSVRRFLREAQFPKAVGLQVSEVFRNNADARQAVLLLRGLLIHKILLMGLSKRWNVQYGIDPRRDPIAVPFSSKGTPSDQSEYGHPDVSILLTCLSFYYSGLTMPQFRQNLAQLLKSDEPVREFDSWMNETRHFPNALRSWSSINIDDAVQCTQLWDLLRHQMNVINFFLNHFVFPRHAKTFQRKLVSSGWDIAMQAPPCRSECQKVTFTENSNPAKRSGEHPEASLTSLTVGFSGTNDNKTLLPLNVLQDDLPSLSHTNAEVLTYLLQGRNRRYFPACDRQGRRLGERAFLKNLHDMQIRMLLDAGAQIIELDNQSLARTWLLVDTEAEAAVYFGEDGRARVLYKDGRGQPLAGSPFLDNLGSCLVYLDEAHTRGVDLKMPANAIAALTLGIMQTKDHTVQAAMRLRQLAISQSVVFFAPPEVHQSILNVRSKTNRDKIDSSDVIIWLLEQTCCNIEQLQPLYISQGLEYCRRWLAGKRNPSAASQPEERKKYLEVLEQPEQYSLEKLYAPDQRTKSKPIDAIGFPAIAEYVAKLTAMKKELRNTSNTVQALAHQEVEQEREVQIEVETVREVKKPNHAQALPQPPLQKDIRFFAETGRLMVGSQAYQQVYVALRQTTLGRRLGISDCATKSTLFVSRDFSNTVVNQGGKHRDEYSRPVHWILWSESTEIALICSDFETDAILPIVRDSKSPCTHLITYAAPVTKAMLVFDTLKLYTIPSLPATWRAPAWLVCDLGIFAGRLYFDLNDQCSAVYKALGLPPPASTISEAPAASQQSALLHGLPDNGGQEEIKPGPFSPVPLLFMQEWLAIRRKGQDFSQTMMGELCRGRRLERDVGVKVEENLEEQEVRDYQDETKKIESRSERITDA